MFLVVDTKSYLCLINRERVGIGITFNLIFWGRRLRANEGEYII